MTATVKTKYNVGDEVFFMHQNNIKNGKIERIIFTLSTSMYPQWCSNTLTFSVRCEGDLLNFRETDIYKTKSALIKSL